MLETMRVWMGWDEGISEKALRMRSYHFWDQQKKMSPQPLIGKRAPGAGFEILFEFRCPGFIAESNVIYQSPGQYLAVWGDWPALWAVRRLVMFEVRPT
jgi:hypothetical protein